MVQHGAVGHAFESIAQHPLAFRIAALGTVEVGKIRVCRNKAGIVSDRCFNFLFGLGRLAAIRIKGSEIDARFGPIGIISLAGDILGAGALESRALLRA